MGHVDGQGHIAAGVVGTIVDVVRRDGGQAGAVERHRHILSEGDGRAVVLNRHRCGCRRGVATVIRSRERYRCRTSVSAEVGKAGEVVRPGGVSAEVRRCCTALIGEPGSHFSTGIRTALDGGVRSSGRQHRCRRVHDREAGHRRGGIAALVRGREGHVDGTRSDAGQTKVVEVVAPRDAAARIAGGTCAAIGEQPSVEADQVIRAVALQGNVRSIAGDGRGRRVRDGEGGRRAGGISAAVGHREGHRLSARSTTTVGEARAVVGPGQGTACVRSSGTTIVGEPSRKQAGEVTARALHGAVGGRHHHDRGCVVHHRHCGGGCGTVAAVVGYCQGDGGVPEVQAAEARQAGTERHGSATIRRAIVETVSQQSGQSRGIQGQGVVLGAGRRVGRILNGERGIRRGRVSTHIGCREGHGRGTRLTTEVAQTGVVVCPGHAATVLAGCGATMVGEPCRQLGCISGSVALRRGILGRSRDGRSCGVLNGEGG